MRRIVSYATVLYRESRGRLFRSAFNAGVEECWGFSSWHLYISGYYLRHHRILAQRRGSGYWLWKPFILLRAMEKAQEGDVVLYLDSDFVVTSSLTPLFDLASNEQPVILFRNHGRLNRCWTKRDCFVLMGCDSSPYHESEQVNGAPVLLFNCKASRAFVAEWLSWCEDERILTDMQNVCGMPNLEGFREHRHDQSVLSLLAVKHKVPVFRNPSQYGNSFKLPEYPVSGEYLAFSCAKNSFANSPYGTLLITQPEAGKSSLFHRILHRLFRSLGQNV